MEKEKRQEWEYVVLYAAIAGLVLYFFWPYRYILTGIY